MKLETSNQMKQSYMVVKHVDDINLFHPIIFSFKKKKSQFDLFYINYLISKEKTNFSNFLF